MYRLIRTWLDYLQLVFCESYTCNHDNFITDYMTTDSCSQFIYVHSGSTLVLISHSAHVSEIQFTFSDNYLTFLIFILRFLNVTCVFWKTCEKGVVYYLWKICCSSFFWSIEEYNNWSAHLWRKSSERLFSQIFQIKKYRLSAQKCLIDAIMIIHDAW